MKRFQTHGMPFWLASLIGSAVTMVIGLLLLALEAFLVLQGNADFSYSNIIGGAILLIACLSGCLVAGLAAKEKKLYAIGGAVLISLFVLGAINILGFDGIFVGWVSCLLIGAAGAGAAFMLTTRKGRGGKVKIRKKYYC